MQIRVAVGSPSNMNFYYINLKNLESRVTYSVCPQSIDSSSLACRYYFMRIPCSLLRGAPSQVD
jgi:hypothetical protein